MTRLYHGTSYEAGVDIIRNGFHSPDTIWSCSDPEKTYFIKSDYDEDEDKDLNDDAVMFAVDASKIAAAHFDSKATSTFLFEITMSDETFDDEMLPDTSCENADDCYCIDSETLNELISDGKITLTVYLVKNAYNTWLRPFYLCNLSSYYEPNDEVLHDAIRCLQESQVIDAMYDHLFGCAGIELYSEIEPTNA